MPSLVTVHWSSDLQMPYESDEAYKLQLPYIIYNSLTNIETDAFSKSDSPHRLYSIIHIIFLTIF